MSIYDNNPVYWADPSGADAHDDIMNSFYSAGNGITTYTNDNWGGFKKTGHKSDDELARMGVIPHADLSDGGGGNSGGGIGAWFKRQWNRIFGEKDKSSVIAEDMGSATVISDSDIATIAQESFKEMAIILKQRAFLGTLTNQNLITFSSQNELLGVNVLVYNKEKIALSKTLMKYSSYAGKAGNALTAFDIMYNTYLYDSGQITGERYSYRMTSAVSSILAGAAFGGPAGLAVGVTFAIAESLYDQYHDYNSVPNQAVRQVRASFNWNAYDIMHGFGL